MSNSQTAINSMHIKSPDDVSRTVARNYSSEIGYVTNKHSFILYLLAAISIISQHYRATVLIALLFFADFAVYVMRRRSILHKYICGTPRIESSKDFQAIDALYDRNDIKQPTMVDWEKAYGHSAPSKQWKVDLHYKLIKDLYELNKNHINTVVDIGTNDGRLSYKYKVGSDKLFVGVDVSGDLLKEFRSNLSDNHVPVAADGTQLPFKESSADFIVCSEVLEHLSRPSKALAEFDRVLRKNGHIVIQSPNAARIRNINPFYILSRIIGLLFPDILQGKVVHENTWITAYTYHWDFSRQDIRRFTKGTHLKVIEMFGAFYYFNTNGNILNKILFSLFRYTPILNQLGGDLVVVLKKR